MSLDVVLGGLGVDLGTAIRRLIGSVKETVGEGQYVDAGALVTALDACGVQVCFDDAVAVLKDLSPDADSYGMLGGAALARSPASTKGGTNEPTVAPSPSLPFTDFARDLLSAGLERGAALGHATQPPGAPPTQSVAAAMRANPSLSLFDALSEVMAGRRHDIRAAFAKVDGVGKGRLAMAEVDAAFGSLGVALRQADLDAIKARFSRLGDGYLAWRELLDCVAPDTLALPPARVMPPPPDPGEAVLVAVLNGTGEPPAQAFALLKSVLITPDMPTPLAVAALQHGVGADVDAGQVAALDARFGQGGGLLNTTDMLAVCAGVVETRLTVAPGVQVDMAAAQDLLLDFLGRLVDKSEDALKDAFMVVDANNSGSISKQEMGRFLEKLGAPGSADVVDAIWARMDVDGSGLVTWTEFKAFVGGAAAAAARTPTPSASPASSWSRSPVSVGSTRRQLLPPMAAPTPQEPLLSAVGFSPLGSLAVRAAHGRADDDLSPYSLTAEDRRARAYYPKWSSWSSTGPGKSIRPPLPNNAGGMVPPATQVAVAAPAHEFSAVQLAAALNRAGAELATKDTNVLFKHLAMDHAAAVVSPPRAATPTRARDIVHAVSRAGLPLSPRASGTLAGRFACEEDAVMRYADAVSAAVDVALRLIGRKVEPPRRVPTEEEAQAAIKKMATKLHIKPAPGGSHVGFVEKVFQTADTDHNGVLTMDEFRSAVGMLDLGTPEEDLETLFLYYDLDGDGVVSYPEFLGQLIDYMLKMQAVFEDTSNTVPSFYDTFKPHSGKVGKPNDVLLRVARALRERGVDQDARAAAFNAKARRVKAKAAMTRKLRVDTTLAVASRLRRRAKPAVTPSPKRPISAGPLSRRSTPGSRGSFGKLASPASSQGRSPSRRLKLPAMPLLSPVRRVDHAAILQRQAQQTAKGNAAIAAFQARVAAKEEAKSREAAQATAKRVWGGLKGAMFGLAAFREGLPPGDDGSEDEDVVPDVLPEEKFADGLRALGVALGEDDVATLMAMLRTEAGEGGAPHGIHWGKFLHKLSDADTADRYKRWGSQLRDQQQQKRLHAEAGLFHRLSARLRERGLSRLTAEHAVRKLELGAGSVPAAVPEEDDGGPHMVCSGAWLCQPDVVKVLAALGAPLPPDDVATLYSVLDARRTGVLNLGTLLDKVAEVLPLAPASPPVGYMVAGRSPVRLPPGDPRRRRVYNRSEQ